MLDFLKSPVLVIQEYYTLSGRALANTFRRPFYLDDLFLQMDVIGVGSLPIVVLIGFFTGAVMGLQMARTLAVYGQQGLMGQVVAVVLVRELGPVLTSVLMAGRNASGIASELGSMKVTEQIDAMRALGTDPVKKLVTPRVLATTIVLPLLTAISDFIGLVGGFLMAWLLFHQTASQYWQTAWRALEWNDLAQGLLKPAVFAVIVASVGCFYGLRTTGGTQGVGLATTKAVVVSCIWIFVADLFMTQIFVNM